MRTGFLCDVDLPNYITSPDSYNYLPGKHSATGYYYWILKNNNISDIHLVSPDDNLNLYDTIVYHYDNKECINHSCYNTIQVVSDRPFDPKADILIAANRHVVSPVKSVEIAKRYGISSINSDWIDQSKWRFIHYPPTYGIKKCTAQWPPTNFKFVGREHTLIPEIKTPQFIDKCSRAGFNLILDFDSDGNRGDEDVYFCVRNVSHKGKTTGIENNFGPGGHRTANRLYQGWFMNTPCIFTILSRMMPRNFSIKQYVSEKIKISFVI